MEKFKKLEEIIKPDPRSDLFQVFDESLNDFRMRELKDIHKSLDQIRLNDNVPEDIRSHFITSKHLVLYSWFVYRFIPVAELHAITTLEYALKDKTKKENWGLKKLLKYAVKQGWVKDSDFEVHRQSQEEKAIRKEMYEKMGRTPAPDETPLEGSYTSVLIETVPYIRNVYAHGSNTIAPQGYLTLRICTEFINAMYERSSS